jgi:hypothetical protein
LLQFTPAFPSPRILPQRQMVELTTPPPGAGSICFLFSKPSFDHSHIPLPPPAPVAVAVAASQHGEQNIYVQGISRTLVSLSYGEKKRCSPFCCSYYARGTPMQMRIRNVTTPGFEQILCRFFWVQRRGEQLLGALCSDSEHVLFHVHG